MSKVLITDKIDKNVVDQVKNSKIIFDYKPDILPEDLVKIIGKYEGLIVRSRTKVTKAVIGQGKRLKVIGRVGSGLDNIDIEAAKKAKIMVTNSPGANSKAVAELCLGLILSLLRQLSSAYSSMTDGFWLKKNLRGEELEGKKVGVIGYGHIGKRATELLIAFGANVDYFSRTEKTNSLKYIFKNSDIISIHLPLNNETKNFINEKLLSLMKPTSFLVNTARGGVVDEKILFKMLKEKRIAGAALDVFWQEPLAPDSPWRKLDNVILTPHLGASTREALTRATHIVINQTVKILSKK